MKGKNKKGKKRFIKNNDESREKRGIAGQKEQNGTQFSKDQKEEEQQQIDDSPAREPSRDQKENRAGIGVRLCWRIHTTLPVSIARVGSHEHCIPKRENRGDDKRHVEAASHPARCPERDQCRDGHAPSHVSRVTVAKHIPHGLCNIW